MNFVAAFAITCQGQQKYIEENGQTCTGLCSSRYFTQSGSVYQCVSQANCKYKLYVSGAGMTQCFDICVDGFPYVETTTNCVARCASGTYIITNGELLCQSQSVCPQKYIVNISNANSFQCVAACAPPVAFDMSSQCVESCGGSKKYVEENSNVCTSKCASDHFRVENNTFRCVAKSSCNLYVNESVTNSMNECVDSCNSTYAYVDGKQCRSFCTYFTTTDTAKICVGSCQQTDRPFFVSTSGLTPAQCISACTTRYPYNYENGQCTDSCGSDFVLSLDSKSCISLGACSEISGAEVVSNKCACQSSFYLQVDLKGCVGACGAGEVVAFNSRVCATACVGDQQIIGNVCSCSKTTYLNTITMLCVSTCPSPLYVSEDNATCVQTCSVAHKDGKCLAACSGFNSVDKTGLCTQNMVKLIGLTAGPAVGVIIIIIVVIATICAKKKKQQNEQDTMLKQAASSLPLITGGLTDGIPNNPTGLQRQRSFLQPYTQQQQSREVTPGGAQMQIVPLITDLIELPQNERNSRIGLSRPMSLATLDPLVQGLPGGAPPALPRGRPGLNKCMSLNNLNAQPTQVNPTTAAARSRDSSANAGLTPLRMNRYASMKLLQ